MQMHKLCFYMAQQTLKFEVVRPNRVGDFRLLYSGVQTSKQGCYQFCGILACPNQQNPDIRKSLGKTLTSKTLI